MLLILASDFKYARILNVSLVLNILWALNIPGFGIYQGSEYVRFLYILGF